MGEANAYLMQFVETEDAWLCCLKLLRSEDNFVQYFAANMLLTKVSEVMHAFIDTVHQYNEVTAGQEALESVIRYTKR